MKSKSISVKIEKTVLLLASLMLVFVLFNATRHIESDFFVYIKEEYLNGFTIVFLSVILEAMPFIIIGSFISSIIQIFVSEETIARIIPKNRYVGLLVTAFMGLIFPVCECAIVPIGRRLIKKGVPIHLGVTFMLAVPIVNPVVIMSTYYAFSNEIYIVLLRTIIGLMGAILIGHLVGILQGDSNPLKENIDSDHTHSHGCGCSCGHDHSEVSASKNKAFSKVNSILEHTSLELYSVGKFLIIGAFLSAMVQTFVPANYILSVGRGEISSIIVMMTLAFVISLCSEADAFIARTFLGQFTTGSIVAFLILGPMVDLKNILMLSSSFKFKFILKHAFTVFAICFAMAMMINIVGL